MPLKQENPVLAVKISAITSHLICGGLIPQIEIPLIIMCGARLSERPTTKKNQTLCNIKDEQKARMTAEFINFN